MNIKKGSIVLYYNTRYIVKSVNKKTYSLYRNSFRLVVDKNKVQLDEMSFSTNEIIYTIENEFLYDQFNMYDELSKIIISFNNVKLNEKNKGFVLFDRKVNFKTIKEIVKNIQNVNRSIKFKK